MIFETSRRGCLVPAVCFTACVVAYMVAPPSRSKTEDDKAWAWALTLAFFVAALVVLAIGRWIRRRDGRIVWDPRRKKYVRLPTGDTFFWIDVWHCGWIVLAFSLLLAYHALTRAPR
jgi:hypothetical protein